MLPGEKIEEELKKFFANTLDRHGSNCWTDLQNSAFASDVRVSEHLPPPSPSQSETLSEEKNFIDSTVGPKIQGTEATSGLGQTSQIHVSKAVSSLMVPEFGYSLDGGIKEAATFGIPGARKTNGPTHLSVNNHLCTTVAVSSDHSHQFCSSDSCGEKGKIEKLHSCEEVTPNSAIDGMSFTSNLEDKRKHLTSSHLASSCSNGVMGSAVLNDVTNVSEITDHVESHIANISGSSRALKFLLDLNGDYESHFRNLQYGQFCHGYAISAPVLFSPPLSPQLPNKNSWETMQKSLQFQQNVNSRSHRNCVALGPQFYPGNHSSLPFAVVGEENKKPRGTGTYIPNVVLSFVYSVQQIISIAIL